MGVDLPDYPMDAGNNNVISHRKKKKIRDLINNYDDNLKDRDEGERSAATSEKQYSSQMNKELSRGLEDDERTIFP